MLILFLYFFFPLGIWQNELEKLLDSVFFVQFFFLMLYAAFQLFKKTTWVLSTKYS